MDRKETPDRITLDIHGVRIALSSTSEDAIHLLCDRLESYVCEAADDCEATVTIEATPSPADPSSIKKEFSWVRSRPLWGNLSDNTFSLTDGRSVATTHYEKRAAEIFIHPDTLSDTPFASRTFLLLPILELLRTFGFFYVHGALLAKGDEGLLLLGQGGSGKSTLSAALLGSDWKIIGDDNLLFHLGPESTSLGFPFERELSISQEVADQLNLPFEPETEGAKFRIPLNKLPQELVANYTHPDRIVCLWKGDEDEASPLDGSEIFQLVVEENPLLLISPALASSHVDAIRSLIRNARCQRLSLARHEKIDLTEIANRFSQLVGD